MSSFDFFVSKNTSPAHPTEISCPIRVSSISPSLVGHPLPPNERRRVPIGKHLTRGIHNFRACDRPAHTGLYIMVILGWMFAKRKPRRDVPLASAPTATTTFTPPPSSSSPSPLPIPLEGLLHCARSPLTSLLSRLLCRR